MIGRLEPRHVVHVFGDGPRLSSFFGADARIGTGRVDEADHRQAEFGGQTHLGHRFAIAFGVGTAEIAGGPFLVRPALFVPDDHDLALIEFGEPGQHGPVVAKQPVAVQFDKLVKHRRQIVDWCGDDPCAARPGRFPRASDCHRPPS